MDKNILLEISEEFDLPVSIIEQVVRSQFKFTADTIREGSLRPVRHPYLGVFAVKPRRLEYLTRKKE